MLSSLVNTSSTKCPNINITNDVKNELRRYRYCEAPANLSTVDELIELYEDNIEQVIGLLIQAEIDVRAIQLNVLPQQQQCPYGATVYDSCNDGM